MASRSAGVERDPLIINYSHLRSESRSGDALVMLQKVASMVKPIMRARGWKVGELAEFYPDDPRLLGRLLHSKVYRMATRLSSLWRKASTSIVGCVSFSD